MGHERLESVAFQLNKGELGTQNLRQLGIRLNLTQAGRALVDRQRATCRRSLCPVQNGRLHVLTRLPTEGPEGRGVMWRGQVCK